MNVQTCMTVIKCFFVFKQKTAYEMRISDWSSDVCSSDLIVEEEGHLELVALDRLRAVGGRLAVVAEELDAIGPLRHLHREMDVAALGPAIDLAAAGEHAVVAEVERRIHDDDALVPIRSEERRGGYACVSTCRYWWSSYNLQKETNLIT